MHIKRVLLIGYGFSGRRIYRVLQYLKRELNFKVVGIIDKNKNLDFPRRVKFYSTIEHFFINDCNGADIAIIATNDFNHEIVFKKLSKYKNIDIISEKPLVKDIRSYKRLRSFFEERKVYINYVERFSPVLDDLLKFLAKNPIKLTKGIFFWGKDRYFDKRPTQGVYAEITHPLDLLIYLFNFKSPYIKVNSFTKFEFAVNNKLLVDSLDITIKENGLEFKGHSSFTWFVRKREFILYGKSEKNKNLRYQINLRFDNEKWDRDSISINVVNIKKKRRKEILFKNYPNKDYILDLDQLNKIFLFLKMSFISILKNEPDRKIAVLRDGQKNLEFIQQIKNQINKRKSDKYGFI